MPEPQKRSSVTPLTLYVEAGVEHGHPAEVTALGPHLHAGAEHDVVDVGGVEVVAIDDSAEHRRAEALRMDLGQRCPCRPCRCRGRAAGVDEPSLGHGK